MVFQGWGFYLEAKHLTNLGGRASLPGILIGSAQRPRSRVLQVGSWAHEAWQVAKQWVRGFWVCERWRNKQKTSRIWTLGALVSCFFWPGRVCFLVGEAPKMPLGLWSKRGSFPNSRCFWMFLASRLRLSLEGSRLFSPGRLWCFWRNT